MPDTWPDTWPDTSPDTRPSTWKVTLPCIRAEAEALSEDNLFVSSADSVPTIVTREVDPAFPDQWSIDVYCDAKPDAEMLRNIARLVPSTKVKPQVERLSDQDWVTMSQRDLKPLRAGRFHVHTSSCPALDDPKIRNICIDASQAFGTGHHETTIGCMETLDELKRRGRHFRNIVDVGTGTGLLAFAARHLWPDAKIIASDIDPIAIQVSRDNANSNNITTGAGRRDVRLLASNGLDHIALQRRAPYDLIIANILAGPLVALAPQIAAAATSGTILILAGLLNAQKAEVVRGYARNGFRLRRTRLENQWPCLTMVKKRNYGRFRSRQRTKSPLAADYFGEC